MKVHELERLWKRSERMFTRTVQWYRSVTGRWSKHGQLHTHSVKTQRSVSKTHIQHPIESVIERRAEK